MYCPCCRFMSKTMRMFSDRSSRYHSLTSPLIWRAFFVALDLRVGVVGHGDETDSPDEKQAVDVLLHQFHVPGKPGLALAEEDLKLLFLGRPDHPVEVRPQAVGPRVVLILKCQVWEWDFSVFFVNGIKTGHFFAPHRTLKALSVQNGRKVFTILCRRNLSHTAFSILTFLQHVLNPIGIKRLYRRKRESCVRSPPLHAHPDPADLHFLQGQHLARRERENPAWH